jgi:hypothetical protein
MMSTHGTPINVVRSVGLIAFLALRGLLQGFAFANIPVGFRRHGCGALPKATLGMIETTQP